MREDRRRSPGSATLVALGALASLLLVVSPVWAQQADPPHWKGPLESESTNCTSACHMGHNSSGGALTPAGGNVALCQSCHSAASDLPIYGTDVASPGLKGTHHGFDVPAVNTVYDTQTPDNKEMKLRIMDGKVVCSTCHNQHSGAIKSHGADSRVGTTRQPAAWNLGGTGDVDSGVESGFTYDGDSAFWYVIDIAEAGSETTARFRWAKRGDGYTTPWVPTWTPSTNCDPGGTTSGCLVAGTAVAIENRLTVTFTTGTFAVGERWEFSASYPFLRATLDSKANDAVDRTDFCRDCHRNWVMKHDDPVGPDTREEGWTADTPRSHPTGIKLDANGLGNDRAAPRDGDGSADDGNPGNDLVLFNDGTDDLVLCLTCHSVHYADSNTNSVDGP